MTNSLKGSSFLKFCFIFNLFHDLFNGFIYKKKNRLESINVFEKQRKKIKCVVLYCLTFCK